MKSNKYLTFLIAALSFTAFLAGYLMISGGIGSGSKTGTILDKFGDQQPTTNNQQPTEDEPFLISGHKVSSLTNSSGKGGVMYYEQTTGKVFGYDFESKTERTISETVLPNFFYSVWSPTKQAVLSTFYTPSGTELRYYSSDTGKSLKLDSKIHSAAFSPDGTLIAYFYSDKSASPSEPGGIMISQPDGLYSKKIMATRLEDLQVSWPSRDNIAFKTPNLEIFLLTQEGKLTKLLGPLSLLEEKWSVGGNKVLFSGTELGSTNPILSVKILETRNEIPLGIPGNASRCTWSIDEVTIFCALSKSPSEDEVYSISTLDGSKKLVAEPGVLIKEIYLSPLEDYLLFVDSFEEKLYGKKLP